MNGKLIKSGICMLLLKRHWYAVYTLCLIIHAPLAPKSVCIFFCTPFFWLPVANETCISYQHIDSWIFLLDEKEGAVSLTPN